MTFKRIYEETCLLFKYADPIFITAAVLGGLAVISLPVLHMLFYRYVLLLFTYKTVVDPDFCSNTCWDTVFKGGYENIPAGYKHVYFNATANTLKMWIITVLAMLSFYEAVRYLVKLGISGKLRKTMTCLFIINIYPHYYTWWSFFNYWNDDFYTQWMHQILFSATELLSTLTVLVLCNTDQEIRPHFLLLITDISVFHVVGSAIDQFITNVVLQKGDLHQLPRDIAFMIPDIVHIGYPAYLLCKLQLKYSRQSGPFSQKPIQVKDLLSSAVMIGVLVLMCLIF